MYFSTVLKIIFIVLMVWNVTSANRSVVNTTIGHIRGKFVDEYGAKYYSYTGIPYAENPTGELRFKSPVPKSPWTAVRDATSEGFACPQAEGSYTREEMSEDCLNLNVYVPLNNSDGPLPVLVYIHGGDFKMRSSRSDDIEGPQLLIRKGLLVVTVNYRLAALGFLSLENNETPGNAGLKDTILALKWIKENIETFGGDAQRITIGGNSAGAGLTHILMLSPKSNGLFNQALLISGSVLTFRYITRTPKANAMMLANYLGIQSTDPKIILGELQIMDPFAIVKAQDDMGKNYKRKGFITFTPFTPSIEMDSDDAVLTQDPRETIKSDIPQNIPVLAQLNTDEGLKMYPTITKNQTLVDYLNDEFELCIPSNILYPYGSTESKQLAKSIREFYFKSSNISNSTIQDFIDMVSDSTFVYGIDSWIKIHKGRSDSNKVYLYRFGFDGELNWDKILYNLKIPGTAHADELGYLFVTNVTKSRLGTVDQMTRRMVHVMTTMLANFVKYGNPTPSKEDIGVIFEETNVNRNHLFIDNCSITNVREPPTPERMQFWYNTYNEYYQYLNNGGEIEYKDYSNVEFA